MSNRTIKYTSGEIGRVKVIEDFLPSPDALVAREDNVKVTPQRRRSAKHRRVGKAKRAHGFE